MYQIDLLRVIVVHVRCCLVILIPIMIITVDGFWTAWSSWSDCSVTCENGTQYRTRQCNSPLHGGAHCPGDDKEIRECFPKMCPGNDVLIVYYLQILQDS